ncbi:MAG: hypothetical protein HC878_09195 [Leptolyngbyaceae cyanobacterium SL_5_14]|nr:hypothetical protein [Leptolyngbyaceae cyanobacterium SL_5_14]
MTKTVKYSENGNPKKNPINPQEPTTEETGKCPKQCASDTFKAQAAVMPFKVKKPQCRSVDCKATIYRYLLKAHIGWHRIDHGFYRGYRALAIPNCIWSDADAQISLTSGLIAQASSTSIKALTCSGS